MKRVPLTLLVHHVIEERTELRAGDVNAGIGDSLHKPIQVKFGSERDASAIEDLQCPGFLAQFRNARLQRFIGRQQPRLEVPSVP